MSIRDVDVNGALDGIAKPTRDVFLGERRWIPVERGGLVSKTTAQSHIYLWNCVFGASTEICCGAEDFLNVGVLCCKIADVRARVLELHFTPIGVLCIAGED